MYIHINDVCNDLGNDKSVFFIALLVVIQPKIFVGRGRSQHGRPGNVTRR